MHVVPRHHGWEVSACIGSVAVTIFVDDMTSIHKENYHYKYFYCKTVTKTINNTTSTNEFNGNIHAYKYSDCN